MASHAVRSAPFLAVARTQSNALPVEPGFAKPLLASEVTNMLKVSVAQTLSDARFAAFELAAGNRMLQDSRVVAKRNGPSANRAYVELLSSAVQRGAALLEQKSPSWKYEDSRNSKVPPSFISEFPPDATDASFEPGLAKYAPIHVSQKFSAFNPLAVSPNANCAPAAAVMALRYYGNPQGGGPLPDSAQSAIESMRARAGGGSDQTLPMYTSDIASGLKTLGIQGKLTDSVRRVLRDVKSGHPVVAQGDASKPGGWYDRFGVASTLPQNTMHHVFVSAYEAKTGAFIVNDPSSLFGAFRVKESELRSFLSSPYGKSLLLPTKDEQAKHARR